MNKRINNKNIHHVLIKQNRKEWLRQNRISGIDARCCRGVVGHRSGRQGFSDVIISFNYPRDTSLAGGGGR